MTDPTRDDDTPGDRADGDEPVDAEIIDVDGESVLDADIGSDAADAVDDDFPDITVEGDIDTDLVEMVEVGVRLQAERDEYLDMARRVQAEFENYKRRVETQRVEQRARAAEDLAAELLPVLDAGEAAVTQGHEHAAALHTQLLITLEKRGLERVDQIDVPFDPNVHEAVLHEEGDSEAPEVAEVMRAGYLWNSRVIRPAMVKVRG
ncbi:MAG: nucleotide exchange factor GrpE [Microthrixaceae bacterium]